MIGLDISSSSVKLVELGQSANGEYVLERFGAESFEKGWITDGQIEKFDEVADAVKRVVGKSGTRTKQVVMAMPQSAVITKKIMLPAGLREEDYEFQVESEASQYIPFPIDEVNIDFQIIGPSANSEEEVDVLLAASRKEKVEDCVAVAEMAGVKPVVIDVEPYAIRASVDYVNSFLPNNGQGQIIAVAMVGQSSTYLTIVLNGQTIFEREQSFGGNQLTQDIMRLYGLGPEEAESKKRAGELPDGYEEELLRPFVGQGATDIGRALQFFFTSTPYTRVDQIFLAGGSSVVPGLAEAVAERTQVPTELFSPFQGMEIAGNLRERQLRSDAPALLVATGLAMRRFDP